MTIRVHIGWLNPHVMGKSLGFWSNATFQATSGAGVSTAVDAMNLQNFSLS